ncbi:diheme cytochrome c-553 [candidate division KSB1 bacterium]|nr:diheme cytochrome c-553 [candidate division KSB1 bacterium]
MCKMIVTLMLGVSWAAFMGCQSQQKTAENPVERGKYLVSILGCHDCHTPKAMDAVLGPVPDTTRLLSGNPENFPYPTWTPADLQQRNAMAMTNAQFTVWAGPWGVSFTMNLTPDIETGLGEWTEETFIRAIRTGKHQGQPNGRDILPPMPWIVYRDATDEDLKAIWAYLRSIPPIKNQVPLPIPPGSSTNGSSE